MAEYKPVIKTKLAVGKIIGIDFEKDHATIYEVDGSAYGKIPNKAFEITHSGTIVGGLNRDKVSLDRVSAYLNSLGIAVDEQDLNELGIGLDYTESVIESENIAKSDENVTIISKKGQKPVSSDIEGDSRSLIGRTQKYG